MRFETELEYVLNCSLKVLLPRLSTAGGLCEWFADDVSNDDDIFTFVWNDWSSKARLVSSKDNKIIRFEWEGHTAEEPHFFEFRILVEEMSGSLALIIIDVAEHDDKEDARNLWDAHVTDLKRALGI